MLRQFICFPLFVTLILLQIGCASSRELNKKDDYRLTYTHLKTKSYGAALKSYPSKEKLGFITTTEKSWIGLLSGDSTDLKSIIKMGRQLPAKETTIISDEVSYFFYKKTADGYFPAEHEVIVFHLISAMNLLKQKNTEEARVEAKKAAFYLQDDYVNHQGAFDDPFLRVWLASIWVALEEWSPAQVDLRKASELSETYKWAGELAKKEQLPKKWIVVFQGTGPEIRWNPQGLQQHWTGKGSVQFEIPKHVDVNISMSEKDVIPFKALSSTDMYIRHEKRNTAIRETLETSDYMIKSSSLHVSAGAAKGMATAANGVLKVLGVVVGCAIFGGTIYALGKAGASGDGAGELIALSFGLGYGSFKFLSAAGSNLNKSVNQSVDETLENALDVSRTYRFVRFIPDTIVLANIENSSSIVNVSSSDSEKNLESFLKVSGKSSTVEFFFQPL